MLNPLQFLRKLVSSSLPFQKCKGIYYQSSVASQAASPTPSSIMGEDEQKAFTAHFVLRYIMDFSHEEYRQNSLSIRQRLTSKIIFQDYVLNNVNLLPKSRRQQATSFEQFGLQNHNVEEILKAFQIDKGIDYNRYVFYEAGFSKAEARLPQLYNSKGIAENQHKLVFNPSITSSNVLKWISEENDVGICGGKGTGKTVSFLMYYYLSQFITKLRISEGYNPSLPIFKYIEKKQLQKWPKLFYLNLRKTFKQDHLLEMIKQQTYKQQKNPVIFKQFYKSKNIGTRLVLDEVQQFYSLFKARDDEISDIINSKGGYSDKQKIQKRIIYTSKNMQSMRKHFDQLIISSTDGPLELRINQWNKRERHFKAFDLFKNKSKDKLFKDLRYNNYSLSQQSQTQLYLMFWFQIQKQLFFEKIPTQVVQQLKKNFQNTFNLPSTHQQINGNKQLDDSKQGKVIRWSQGMSALCIRAAITQKSLKSLIKLIKSETRNHVEITKELTKLKSLTEEVKQQIYILNPFRGLYLKALSMQPLQFLHVFHHIFLIRKTCLQLLQEGKLVDFISIPLPLNSQKSIVYGFHREKIQTDTTKNQMRIFISPQKLLRMTSFFDFQNLRSNIAGLANVLKLPQISMKEQLFKKYFIQRLKQSSTTICFQQMKEGLFQSISSTIHKTIDFQTINKQSSYIACFSQMVKAAKENPGHIIGGCPITLQGYYCMDNEGFDIALVSFIQQANKTTLKLRLLDLGLDHFTTTSQHLLQKKSRKKWIKNQQKNGNNILKICFSRLTEDYITASQFLQDFVSKIDFQVDKIIVNLEICGKKDEIQHFMKANDNQNTSVILNKSEKNKEFNIILASFPDNCEFIKEERSDNDSSIASSMKTLLEKVEISQGSMVKQQAVTE